MAKKGIPQVEDGYTRLANELLEALAKTRFTNSERRLLDAVFRLTYGIYGRRKAEIELSVLVGMTELRKTHLCRARKSLMDRGVLTVSRGDNRTNLTYQFNKHYKKWKPFTSAVKITTGGHDVTTGVNILTAGGHDVTAGGNPTLLKKTKRKLEKIKESTGAGKKPAPDPAPKKVPPKSKLPPPPYERIIEFFNAMTGSMYDHRAKETRAAIRARFKTGFTEQDFKDVITVKTDQWLGNPKMIAYLRPGTLFRPTKFEGYLNEARRHKQLAKSEKRLIKERRYKIATAILRDEGEAACLAYCTANQVDGEEFKQWISTNTKS